MNKFVRSLLTEWRKLNLPFSNETIIVAVSGGADSVSLTLALHDLKERKKLDLNFIVAHFNHQLRGDESEKDAGFVKELAAKLNFQIEISSPVTELISQKGNLEQNARESRYRFLCKTAEKHSAYAIMTAHTKNDQAETFLLNLIRGSGSEGLGAIHPASQHDKFYLVRPLINWAHREETETFCRDSEISYRLDSMNDDLSYNRVKIRKEVIPLLKKINPNIINTLAQTANLLREQAESLRIDEESLPEQLVQAELKKLSKSNLINVLRAWLLKHRGNLRQLDLKHFEAIERLIKSRKSGRFVELPTDVKVVKKDGKLFFEKTTVEKTFPDN